MLLSQKIAKDVKFLSKERQMNFVSLSDVRLKIIRSPKFIVGNDMLDFDATVHEMRERRGKPLETSADQLAKDMRRYADYARMPYTEMVVENETGLMLLEEVGPGRMLITSVTVSGELLPYLHLTEIDPETATLRYELVCPDMMKMEEFKQIHDEVFEHGAVSMLEVYDILMFLNAPNVAKHQYRPTKRENGVVPRPLLPHYEYRVLDVFRERESFGSMREIYSFLQQTWFAKRERRAHMVKGHWKEFVRGGVKRSYWWSAHMRNRKNLESHGYVDKDYRLRDEE